MPRPRRVPLYVVGSQEEVKSGFARGGFNDLDLLGVLFVGRRTSQRFNFLQRYVSSKPKDDGVQRTRQMSCCSRCRMDGRPCRANG